MSIRNFNWWRENVRKNTEIMRGTNQSIRLGQGARQLDIRQTAGGATGSAIATGAISGDNLSTILESTSLNSQASMLPLISDATIVIQTFGGGNTTVDSYVYGISGSSSAINVQLPDGGVMQVPAYHQGHNFGATGVTVYALFYYDIWAKAWNVTWQSTQFTAAQFALAQQDSMVAVVATPNDSNIGMVTGTGGTWTKTKTGPGFFH